MKDAEHVLFDGSLDTMTSAHASDWGAVVFGIVRPCEHRLGDGLRAAWMAHLCGLCLALRTEHGQLSRIVTNYDGLIVSVLTEAQVGGAGGRRTAGPCPLRGMRTAPVARGEGVRLAAAVSLVLASAKVRDHVADRDGVLGRRPLAAAARRVAAGWDRAGARTGAEIGFDTAVLVDAVDRQPGIEAAAGRGTPLLHLTEPTESATAAAFAHTAVLAGLPGNKGPLAEAGRLFGRLAHLLDAVEDQETDAARGALNPLTVTATSRTDARRLADDAVHGIRLALRQAEFPDGALAHALLTHELRVSVDRAFATAACSHHEPGTDPQAGTGPHGSPGPHNAHPYGSQSPYGGGSPGAPGGPDDPSGMIPGPRPEPPRRRRGLWEGCAVGIGLLCTCRACCAREFEGPWSRKKRDGFIHTYCCCSLTDGCTCDCTDCCCCDCS